MRVFVIYKSIPHEADDHFGLQSPRCSCVSSCSTGSNCEYYKSLLQNYICHAVRERHPELVENATILYGNATALSADNVNL
jgi:hypothetical protein